ncbi:MAG: glutathione S-transferase C-terminal domain-containing protein [Bradymonadia bacterium]
MSEHADPLTLSVLSLRYSSWSMRAWLTLTHAGIDFTTDTAPVKVGHQNTAEGTTSGGLSPLEDLPNRRALGSVTGLFPVLWVGDAPIHESLAICEWAHEAAPDARLWPEAALDRAQARAICSEMVSGFLHVRQHLSCHPFARVPDFSPDAPTQREIDRIMEIWTACLDRSGGPFLFGHPTIADFVYFPVVTRFETYGVEVPEPLKAYGEAMWGLDAVQCWRRLGLQSPRIPVYDAYIESLGGDPVEGEQARA